MNLFKSKRERNLWGAVLLVLVGILSTLVLPKQILVLGNKLISDGLWVGLFLIGLTILLSGITLPEDHRVVTVIAVLIGITAVYIIVFFRFGLESERSHIIEYSVLGLFIYAAMSERYSNTLKVVFQAFLLTTAIGIIDELIQLLIPYRVFDPVDIMFNTLAAFMAISSSFTLKWIRLKAQKKLK